jgi:hypothetical protein
MRVPSADRSVVAGSVLVGLLAASSVAAPAALAAQSSQAPPAATLRQMYEAGTDFDTFLAAAQRRREMWDANWAKGDPADGFVQRAAALQGRYRILAVAIDSCSDSVNTIPYLARLVERVDQLELQIVPPDVGELLMETYRTPDERSATPTVAILNEDFELVGTWIERPSALQDWFIDHPEISISEKARRKQGWYDWDEGYSTYEEIVALLEAADAVR